MCEEQNNPAGATCRPANAWVGQLMSAFIQGLYFDATLTFSECHWTSPV